ncbi:MAG: hypothetical protein KZQ84_00310 [Candidatus Thiodiazotropha sp. (ex Lucinoma borealis)]|nr:hypothetical protein [Candidatus Thiodiazotropha sp. (ex Lucinoma borealis)]
MDSQFEQMVQVNIQGRVFVICTSHGMTDQTVIGYYTEVLQQAIASMLTDESTPADFHRLLTEQAEWLESEIKQLCESKQLDAPAAPPRKTDSLNEDGSEQSPKPPNVDKKATGYVPDAKSMPERLKDRRAEMEHLLVNDCVTLKLVSPNRPKSSNVVWLGVIRKRRKRNWWPNYGMPYMNRYESLFVKITGDPGQRLRCRPMFVWISPGPVPYAHWLPCRDSY